MSAHAAAAMFLLLGSARAPADPCVNGISAGTAQHLFDVAKKHFPPGNCSFDSISTEKTVLTVNWSAGGKPGPPIRVTTDCRSETLVVDAPRELDSCPGAAALIDALRNAARGEAPVGPPPNRHLRLLAGIALGLAATGVLIHRGSRRRLSVIALRVGEGLADWEISRVAFLTGAVTATGLAAGLRFALPIRQDLGGGDIERLYRTARYSSWEHLAWPSDHHHPGLWFALLHWPFEWSHHSLAVASGFVRGCGVLAVPLGGFLVWAGAGRLASLATMICLALQPLLAVQSQELSDVTLFIALGLTALGAYRTRRGWLLALALGLSFHASYAAVVLAGAIAADAVRTRARWASWPLTGAALLGAPRLWHVLANIPAELSARSHAAELPWAAWPAAPFRSFLAAALHDYFTASLVPPVALLIALWFGRRQLREHGVICLGAVAYAALLLAQPLIAVRPYYATMLPILLFVLAGLLAGPREPAEDEVTARRRRIASLGALAVCALTFASAAADTWPARVKAALVPRASGQVIQAALADGAKTLVSNMGQDWTLATWDFFVDPYATMRGCAREDECALDDMREAASGRRIVELTDSRQTQQPDWEARSVGRLQDVLRQSSAHLLIDRAFPSDTLEAYAAGHCVRMAGANAFELWRCPRS